MSLIKDKFESIINEAGQLVHGDRQEDYGHPLDVFELIAKYWSVALGVEVKAEQIPLLFALHKIAREQVKPKRDNRVDIAGYAETLEMLVHEKALRESVSQGTSK